MFIDNLCCILTKLLILSQLQKPVIMMKAAQFEKGGPELLYTAEVPLPDLRPSEVLIEVYASAINRADTYQRKGTYPPPTGESDILGLEAAGIVARLGPGVTKWKQGDRVMGLLPGGGNAEFVACHEDLLMAVPKHLSLLKAGAVPEAWLTAYQLLHVLGGISPGEHVLIHAGASGVGTAAIQLALLAGAKPIVTAGSEAKLQFTTELGAVAAINYKTEKFEEKVLDFTSGKGCELVLDCVGSSFWKQNVDSLAMEGRWILYGLLGGSHVEGDLLAKILRKRLQIVGTTIRTRSVPYKANIVKSFSKNALPYFETGQLRPIIDTVFPLDKISEAHSYMEGNKNIGKILLEVKQETGHIEL